MKSRQKPSVIERYVTFSFLVHQMREIMHIIMLISPQKLNYKRLYRWFVFLEAVWIKMACQLLYIGTINISMFTCTNSCGHIYKFYDKKIVFDPICNDEDQSSP